MLLTVAVLVLFSCHAWATPIDLSSYGSPPSDDGDGTIQTWLTGLINNYNMDNGASLPTSGVGAHPDLKVDTGGSAPSGYPTFGSGTLSITLPTDDYSYVVLHWGGSGGGVYQAFDLLTISETSDIFNAPGNNGLSSYAFYGPLSSVPEPDKLLLIGAGLVGLAVFRKKFERNLAER